MEFELEKDKTVIEYEPEVRVYSIITRNSLYGTHQQIIYCPWCGTKLSKSLGNEWCAVVKQELGIDTVFAEEWEKLPEEYKTDEWWKKRGL